MSYDGIAPTLEQSPALRAKRARVGDLFCGAGGGSTGAIRAIEEIYARYGWRPDWDFAVVNHWDIAIQTHQANHAFVRHYEADLEHVKPRDVFPSGVLDLLIAAPTCTYHSRARGGRPVHDQQRMDPWHVVRWCTDLRVFRLLVENVPEFVDWGPCNAQTGKPIKSRKGEYFRGWCAALKAIGFRLDWRILNCADYGDVQTRKRFFLIARSDKGPLRWPEPSHSKSGSQDLLGTRKVWRPASEIIDWNIKGKSIFTRKKPLVDNTLSRLLAGADRNHWPQPYLDALQALLDGREPVLDLTPEQAAEIMAKLPPAMVMATGSYGLAHPAGDNPLPTVTTGGNGKGNARPQLIEPIIVHKGSSDGGRSTRPTSEPLPTTTTAGGGFLAEPIIFRSNQGHGRTKELHGANSPLPTLTCSESLAVGTPIISPYYGSGSGETCKSAEQPLDALTTKARFGVAMPVLIRGGHGDDRHTAAGRVIDGAQPLPTVTGSNEIGVAEPVLIRTDQTSGSHDQAARGVSDPVHTIVSKQNAGLAQAFLVPNFGEAIGQAPRTHGLDEPVPTVTAQGHIQLAQPFIVPATHHGDARVHSLDGPLPTVTCAHRGELALAEPAVVGYRIDIVYRMLHHTELGRAAFPDDYIFCGTSTQITKQIGNAIPWHTAKALSGALMEAA